MNPYEAKQEARRERLEAAASRARSSSAANAKRAFGAVSGIPMGQPILVGHHSEKRHRNALARADNSMRKASEDQERAKRLQIRANAVGSGGISSDDPEAVAKLRKELAACEATREMYKRTNREYKKGGWDAVTLSGKEKLRAAKAMYSMHYTKPFPSYCSANISANIRRIKGRIEDLLAKQTRPEAEAIKGQGYTLCECKEDNRIRFEFNGKPNAETRTLLKRNGFRWAPSAGAWQRQLTDNGIAAAELVHQQLRDKGERA